MAKRSEEVNGRKFQVDDSKYQSWAAFELIAKVSDESLKPFQRADAMFEFVELVANLKRQDVVEMAGGEEAPANTVLETLANIIAAASPKN